MVCCLPCAFSNSLTDIKDTQCRMIMQLHYIYHCIVNIYNDVTTKVANRRYTVKNEVCIPHQVVNETAGAGC